MATGIAFYQGMTAQDLRECLDEVPDNTPVWMSKDPEGNKFSRLCAVDKALIDTNFNEPVESENPETEETLILWPV